MGLYKRENLENGAEICVWEISEDEDELRRLCAPIPSDELEELQIISSPARRKEKLAVRALLNVMFPEKLYLGHHDNGKPYLQNCAVEISISHCARFAAIIAHPEESVGIDIESLGRDFSAVERKALSEDEKDDLSDHNTNQQLAIYWCAKEAGALHPPRRGRTGGHFHPQGRRGRDLRAQLRGLRRSRHGLARRLTILVAAYSPAPFHSHSRNSRTSG